MANSSADGPEAHVVRASDADRQEVVDRLEAATVEGRLDPGELRARTEAAYAARTVAQLAALTEDLPRIEGTPVRPAGAAPVPGTGTAPDSAPSDSASPVVAVFGGAERRGRRRPARRESAVAVFGGVVLDYREAGPFPDVLDLRATAVFGGVEILVPAGTSVEMTGFALFGGRSVAVRGAATGAAAPVVRLRAVAVFGGVSVHCGDERAD